MEGWVVKGYEKILEGCDNVVLIEAVTLQVYTYFKTDQMIHFQYTV